MPPDIEAFDISHDATAAQYEAEPNSVKLEKVVSSYPGDELSTARQILFVGTLSMAMFTHQIGIANTLTTVGIIGDSFGITNPGQLSWLIAGYALTVGTFILIGGRLGDEFGYKRLFVIGMTWYTLWTLVAGLAVYSSHVLFVFARILQGMGPAMTLPNGLALLGHSYSPGPRKNMALAWFGGTAPFGYFAGLLCGGLFSMIWWPWIYWSQAIALAGLAIFAAWTIPRIQSQSEKKGTRTLGILFKTLDIPGGVTGVMALVLFNFAWNQAAVVTWKQPYVYVCMLLSLLFAVAFFLIEIYWSEHPILPLKAFNSDIAFVFACTATGWACFGIWVFYITQAALDISHVTPIQLAAWLVPGVPVGLISALAVGKLLGRIPASWIMVIGQVALTIASILAALRPADSIYWTYFFFSVLIIIVGMDTSFPAATIIFSDAVERKYQGMGASVVMTVVNYSISLGLGFAGTIETNINNGGVTEADRLHGYRGGLWLSVGLAGLGLVLSLIFVGKGHWKNRSTA